MNNRNNEKYLQKYSDIKNNDKWNKNPYGHYLKYGSKEGRIYFSDYDKININENYLNYSFLKKKKEDEYLKYYKNIPKKKPFLYFLQEGVQNNHIFYKKNSLLHEKYEKLDLPFLQVLKKKKTKIIINCFNYTEASGGIAITHYLCHLINCITGKNIAYLCPVIEEPLHGIWYGGCTANGFRKYDKKRPLDEITDKDLNDLIINKKWNCPIISRKDLLKRNNVVIYSEEVKGNPLEQKYVMRWLLFFYLPENMKDIINKNELLMYYSSDYIRNEKIMQKLNNCVHSNNNNDKIIFRIFTNLNKIFRIANNYGLKRYGTCFSLRKASNKHNVIHKIHKKNNNNECSNCLERKQGIFFWECNCKGNVLGNKLVHRDNSVFRFEYPMPLESLVFLFNRCKYFYCYDVFTFTPVIATLCGCITIVTGTEHFKGIYNGAPWMNIGIARNNTPDEIYRAKKTLLNSREKLLQIFTNININNVKKLLRIISKI